MTASRLLPFVLAASILSIAHAEEIPHFRAAPKPWPAELGSHRAIVRVDQAAEAVRVSIPWRRRDSEPQKKAIVVVSLKDGKRVAHAAALNVTAESGDVVFTPSAGAGEYAVCYLPVKVVGGAFPRSQYPAPDPAEQTWAAGVTKPGPAKVTGWEAISVQDSFTEMEVIATAAETETVKRRFATAPFATFLEDREHVVRMFDHLPYRWTQPREVVLKAQPGEHCVFQIAVWAHRAALKNLQLKSASLSGAQAIPAESFTCYNHQAVDWNGKPLALTVNVEQGNVLPLWCGVSIPKNAKAGTYQGEAVVTVEGGTLVKVPLTLEISGEVLADGGVSNPESLAKLQWLNSTAGISDQPTRGYTPVEVMGRTLRVLGREIELGDDGLPKRITSYFNSAVTKVGSTPTELLAGPIRFASVESDDKVSVPAPTGKLEFGRNSPARAEWTATLGGGEIKVHGALEFDGSMHYRVAVSGNRAIKDYRLELPRTQATTSLIVGMGQNAGASKGFDWKWNVAEKNQDSVWLGTVNGGLRLQLRSENYERPGVNIHYKRRPLNAPPAWWNEGKGGVSFVPGEAGKPSLLTAFSGARQLTSEPLHFDFDLLITPFHELRTKEQWSDRYYHTGQVPPDMAGYLDKAKNATANVVNVHQGNRLNPYINYPFLTANRLSEFAKLAHDRGMRSKYYYTVRELSNWAPELFAFRAMDNEILLHGKGGGHPWLEEHLAGDYWQAWYEPGASDVSMLTAPMSRLHNFYVEGLRWLVENAGCDGIYLDDIAYDRAIMLRARRVLDQYCPRPALIDLHSWNEFHPGGAFAQCVNIFMDSLPFVDRLWFGEGHHYSGPSAEHFLVEISGIPFGLMGEMLEHGGNPSLGLTFGLTNRLGWQGNPSSVWKLWDDFGVADAEFIGWWAGKDCPVQTGTPDVKASVWRKNGRTLVALGNFAAAARPVKLTIDWKALGLPPEKTKLFAPAYPPLQTTEAVFTAGDTLAVQGHKGLVLWLDESDRTVTAKTVSVDSILREETFATPPAAGWKAEVSTKVAAGAIRAESGLVMQVPANVHAWYETAVPKEATGVSALIWQDGQDEAQQWGPGLAVVWSGGDTLKINRRKDGRIGVTVNGEETFPAELSEKADVSLAARWNDKEVTIVAGGPGMQGLDSVIATFPRDKFKGDPTVIRLGKMAADAGAKDHSSAGPVGFNRIGWLRFHGKPTPAK